MGSRLLLPVIWLVLLFAGSASAQTTTIAERYRQASPFYVRNQIPDNPGSMTLEMADGTRLTLGLMGFSYLERVTPSPTPVRTQFITSPGAKWNFGFAFYQGSSFNFGLPRRYLIDGSNRYTSRNEAYGTIRMVIWTGKVRYEIMEGELRISKFREISRSSGFRHWQVDGTLKGEFQLQNRNVSDMPEMLTVKSASFSCVLIEDRAPSLNRFDLTFDKYYTSPLLLPIRAAKFEPDSDNQALNLNAFETPRRGAHVVHELSFQVRDSANVPWPLHASYLFSPKTVDPLDYLVPEAATRKPLVMSLVYRPAPDIELHYLPENGEMQFSSAQMLAANDQTEVWRVKGTISGTFKLGGRKIGIGSSPAPLAIHPRDDYETVRLTQGTFDLLIRRPAVPPPAWKKVYPGIDPVAGLELPNV